MNKLKVDYSKCSDFIKENELEYLMPMANLANDMVNQKKGPGDEFLGWVDLPVDYDKEEFERIKK